MKTLAEVAKCVNRKIQSELSKGIIYKGAQSVEFVTKELFTERITLDCNTLALLAMAEYFAIIY